MPLMNAHKNSMDDVPSNQTTTTTTTTKSVVELFIDISESFNLYDGQVFGNYTNQILEENNTRSHGKSLTNNY